MSFFKSLTLTFAMYTKIPMPVVEWDERSMQWVFSCFPLVGVVTGGMLWLWLRLALWLGLGHNLIALGGVLIPIALSGGIHLDGLCDTCDALGSHQSKERKLEIMKDSHIGAFGVIGCVLYLLSLFAAWSELHYSEEVIVLLALIPVLSRSFVSLAAVTMKNARGSGLLATFTDASAGKWNLMIIAVWLVVPITFLLLLHSIERCMVFAALLVMLVFLRMSKKEFGGITGDLAGWYLQMLELGMVLALAVFR